MVKQALCCIWQLENKNQKLRLAMNVPCSVLESLIVQNRIEHPYYRDNEYAAKELFKEDYKVHRKFTVDRFLLDIGLRTLTIS